MLLLILFTLLIAFVFGRIYLTARRLPPGPFPFPIVGNVIQLGMGVMSGKGIIGTLESWKEKYGPVHTLWLGPFATVNICDYAIAYDAMVKKGSLFADRANPFLMRVSRKGLGVVSSNGGYWNEQRRFIIHSLKNFGMGKGIIEERITMEIDYQFDILDREIESNGDSFTFDPDHMINLTIGNVINRILFTERFTEEGVKKFFELKRQMDEMMENTTILDMTIVDWSAQLPYFKGRVEKFLEPQNELMAFFREQVQQKRAAIASGDHELKGDGEDFVDAFLIRMATNKEDGAEEGSFTDETLYVALMDLWSAGQESTSSTLYWALTYLLLNNDCLESLEKELLSVTGGHRALNLNDKAKTPYLNAIITETLRCSSIVSMNLWRDTVEDTQVGDYVLPKGTAVTAQLSVIMADPKIFHQPEKFDPTRYIGENRVDPQYVVAFGMGKRACLGESLARAELFMVLGNLVLRYKIKPCPDVMPQMSPRNDKVSIRRAHPYKMIVQRRR